MWTRAFIISTAADLGDLKFVTQRLLRNPADFGDYLGRFYGREKADKFAALLREHLLIAGDLVNAAKARDTATVIAKRKAWYQNADEIAAYLSGINPYWSITEWQRMLYDHLKITENEAVLRLAGQYEKDVALYDALLDQALMMADAMANGVIRQFGI